MRDLASGERGLDLFNGSQKFVSLDGSDYPYGTFFALFGALDASQAANADGSGESNLVGQGE